MSISHSKPDGFIEIGLSTCCCPPDAVKEPYSMHTNGCTNWWRTRTSEEIEGAVVVPWHSLRSPSRAALLADAASTCEEFRQFIDDPDL